MQPPDRARLAQALRRPRNLVLLGVALLLAGLRIGLPYALRPLLVEQADEALVGRIEVGDLGLSLIRGGVTLRDVAVHADELPPVAAPGAEAAPPAAGAPEDPVFRAGMIRARISWLDLFRKQVTVEEFELRDYALNLDRAREGGLVLPKPTPGEEKRKEPTPPTWSVLAEQVQLAQGKVRFRDFAVGEEPSVIELALDNITARDLPIVVVGEGREPGRLLLDARVEGGSLLVDSAVSSRAAGPAVETKLVAKNLPIRNVRLYLPERGWTDLRGRLDTDLVHRFVSGGEHRIQGTVALENLQVQVPESQRPVLSWKRLTVEARDVDLVARRAELSKVELAGARLVVNPSAPFPVLVAMRRQREAELAAVSAAPPAAAKPPEPWSWKIARVAVKDSHALVLGKAEPLDIGIEAKVGELASGPPRRTPLTLALNAGAGTLSFDGGFSAEPVALAGKLEWSKLDLPLLLEPLAVAPAKLVRKGESSGALDVALSQLPGGSSAAGPGNLRVAGRVGFDRLAIEGDDPKQFAVGCDALELAIREAIVPGVLAPAGSAREPIRVKLDRAKLARPLVRLTRTSSGIVVPELANEPSGGVQKASATEAAPAAPTPVEVEVAQAKIERAHVEVVDRAVKPFYRGVLDPIDLDAKGVRWPEGSADSVDLRAKGLDGAVFEATGRLVPGSAALEATLTRLPLSPFNPYAGMRGYTVGSGSASLTTTVKEKKPGTYSTRNKLVLHQLELRGEKGEGLFLKRFGVPLSVGLALMRDVQGDIALKVPVAFGGAGTNLGLGTALGNALAGAIVNALASPLKLVSVVAAAGGRVESITPQPIVFQAGRSELVDGEAPRIEQLAALLGRAPSLHLRLQGVTVAADARWLAEQALRSKLESEQGLAGLRHLGERGARNAALEVLRARGEGRESEIPAEHRAWFEAQVTAQAVDPGALTRLALARAGTIEAMLEKDQGVDASRLSVESAESTSEDAQPSVVIGFGAGEPRKPVAEATS
jgi:hypothetical protein